MMNVRLFTMILVGLGCAGTCAAEFFVAPNGEDTNPGTRSKPFGTFARAQEAVRSERAAHPESGVTVTFQAGVYHVRGRLRFGPEDSGRSADLPVVYRAKPGASVIISGGRDITGWQTDAQHPGVWRTRVAHPRGNNEATWRFDQLWINGRRAVRSRAPNYWEFGVLKGVVEEPAGEAKTGLKHTFSIEPSVLGSLRGLEGPALHDVELVVLHKWDTTRERLDSVSVGNGSIVTHGVKMQSWNMMEQGALFYLENYLGALDSPGEWFLDREGWLYYRPRPNEEMGRVEAIGAEADGFLTVQGNIDKQEGWVKHIRFEGLKFQYGEFRIPGEGVPPAQAAMNVDATAILVDGAADIRFEDCAVEHIGTTAFWFRRACRDCSVLRTRMFDLGIAGVRIGEMIIVPEPVRTGGITISNCIIQSGGRILPHTVAVWIGQSSDNVISHCDVGDFFYTAISVGWRWGYDESAAKRNRIDYNHLHHLGYGILSDMGGVYTLGPSEGTVVRNNIIHDVYATRYGGWGLYPDEGSTGILYENNLVYNVRDGCVHQHYGKENIFRNNILAFSDEGQVALTRAEPHLSFTFEHNIVYWDKGHLLGYDGWKNGAKVVLRNNIYWRADGKAIDFAGKSWDQWRAQGRDEGSLIADPLFVDPVERDFHLRPGTPAQKIGFKAIDFSQCGVQGSAAWKKLAARSTYPKPYQVR
jgi:hypothetical protein